jgi:hypothetical protein
MTKTPAYYTAEFITSVKSLMIPAPRSRVSYHRDQFDTTLNATLAVPVLATLGDCTQKD